MLGLLGGDLKHRLLLLESADAPPLLVVIENQRVVFRLQVL